MSQRTIRILDYKNRPLCEAYMLADGGVAFDFDHEHQISLLSRDSTDELIKLLLDDRRERGFYKPHLGSFAGDL